MHDLGCEPRIPSGHLPSTTQPLDVLDTNQMRTLLVVMATASEGKRSGQPLTIADLTAAKNLAPYTKAALHRRAVGTND